MHGSLLGPEGATWLWYHAPHTEPERGERRGVCAARGGARLRRRVKEAASGRPGGQQALDARRASAVERRNSPLAISRSGSRLQVFLVQPE
jgi:hypothetical protein